MNKLRQGPLKATGSAGAKASAFLPFLPEDNGALSNPASQEALEIINEDLARLLKMKAPDFWHTVKTDRSLRDSIDSYLRFCRRSYDDALHSAPSGAEQQLAKRIFMVVYRMAGTAEAHQGAPSPAQQAQLLRSLRLLDVPMLMDLAVLYGHDNAELTQRLLQQLFELQPGYAEDLQQLCPTLLQNMAQLLEQTDVVAGRLAAGQADLAPELEDAVAYLLDLVLTLHAFITAWPPAAALLAAAEHGSLLPLVASLHDRLLPSLLKAFTAGASSAAALPRLRLLEAGVLQLCWQLLRLAFLTHDYLASPVAARLYQDTHHRGQVLMEQLSACSTGALPPSAGPAGSGTERAMLHSLNMLFRVDAAVSEAAANGLLALDDAQMDYLLAVLGGDRRLLSNRAGQQQAGPSSSSSAAAALAPRDAAVVQSLVSQVKELLPGYGDGFITACLHASSYSAEAVINSLLEGALPAAVAGLDPQLASWKPPSAGPGGGRAGGTAGAAPSSSQAAGPLSWTRLAEDAAAREAAALASARDAVPQPSQALPRRGAARSTARALGSVTDELRQATLALAEEMQAEYDDEYDDSFDDLITTTDGMCEAEGEDSAGAGRARFQGAAGAGKGLGAAAAAAGSGSSGRFSGYEDEPGHGGPSRRGAGPSIASLVSGGRGRGASTSGAAVSTSGRPLPGAPAGALQQPRTAQQQQQQQQRRGGLAKKLYVLDGKIYNYKKEGAQEVADMDAANEAVDAAKAAAEAIYGLGAGGNKGLQRLQQQQQEQHESSDGEEEGEEGGTGRGGGRAGGRGGRGDRGGRGRGPPNFARKEQNKAAVGNHHRKDRATRKMAMGMGMPS